MNYLTEAYISVYSEDQAWRERNFRSMPDKSVEKVANKARKLVSDIKSQKSRPLARFRPGIQKDVKNKSNQLRNITHAMRMKQGDVEARLKAHDKNIASAKAKSDAIVRKIKDLKRPTSAIAPGPNNWNKPSNKKPNASNTIKRFNREDIEYILDYLVHEGYANSYESAVGICESMSIGWIEEIYEQMSAHDMKLSAERGEAKKQKAKERKLQQRQTPLQSKTQRGYKNGQPGTFRYNVATGRSDIFVPD